MKGILFILTVIMLVTGIGYADTTYVAAGNVSGVWTVENSPYVVEEGDILVPSGELLEIGPGVEVFLGVYVTIEVEGCLRAIGVEGDSILFTENPVSLGNFWCQMYLHFAEDTCLFDYCIFEKGSGTNQSGENDGGAIYAIGSNAKIRHCTFFDNFTDWFGGAISLNNCDFMLDSCLFRENHAYEAGGGAVEIWNSICKITNSDFFYNSCVGNGGAIFSNPGYVYIDNCTFTGNGAGYGGGAIYLQSLESVISNSTFYNNGYSGCGQVYVAFGTREFVNCIFGGPIGCGEALYVQVVEEISLSHCCFYDNATNLIMYTNPIPRFEELLTTNINGDSCDIYSNIFMDPQFSDGWGLDFSLMSSSPCIDAGDPTLPFDPDGTISDMGSFYYDQSSELLGLTITVSGNDIILNWNSSPGAVEYRFTKLYILISNYLQPSSSLRRILSSSMIMR